jgi:hypothetical protein
MPACFATCLSGKRTLKAVLCFFLLGLPLLTFAQGNYRKGLVVTSQGDTLKGYLDYQEWNYNPESFAFKAQLADKQSRSFTTQTARLVAIEGYEAYETHRVSISLDEVANSRLREGRDTSTTTATVFLKQLVKGNQVHLYLYKDNVKERYYYLEKGQDRPVELGYKVYLVGIDIATDPVYKQQLAALAMRQKIFTLTPQIKAAAYSRSHLMRIIRQMNGTTDNTISKTLEQAPAIRWFGSAALNYVTFKYQGEDELLIDGFSEHGSYRFKDQIITRSYLPRFSAGADVYLNPAVQRFVIRGELSLAPLKSEVRTGYQHENFSDTSPADEQHNVYRVAMISLSAAPQVLVNAYNTDELKWYLGAGSAFNYRIITENKIQRKRTDQETILSESENAQYYRMRNLALSMLLRTGIVVQQKIDLSLLYSPATQINETGTNRYGISTIKTTSWQLGAGYFF